MNKIVKFLRIKHVLSINLSFVRVYNASKVFYVALANYNICKFTALLHSVAIASGSILRYCFFLGL